MKDYNRRFFVSFQLPSYVDYSPSGANRRQVVKKTSAFYATSRFAAVATAHCLTVRWGW